MQIILSCNPAQYFDLMNIVKDKSDEALGEKKIWFLSYKELPIDGSGRHQVEVIAEPSQFRDISEAVASIDSAALEIVEEAIINNTIGDIDDVNIMEERDLEEDGEEEEEEPEVKIGAVREIGEMEIDRDLMASAKGGIQRSKKQKKKKKNRKKK